MPPRKPVKKSASRRPPVSSPNYGIVYGIGLVLTLGFAWVTWPYVASLLPAANQEKAVQRMAQEHPDAEVFSVPNHESYPGQKKSP